MISGRKEFQVIVTTTPKLVAPDGRGSILWLSTDADIYMGSSYSTTGTWMRVPADNYFLDDVSQDAWYARTLTGSGTVTGWYI